MSYLFLGTIWDPFGLGDSRLATSEVAQRIFIGLPSSGTPLYCFIAEMDGSRDWSGSLSGFILVRLTGTWK